MPLSLVRDFSGTGWMTFFSQICLLLVHYKEIIGDLSQLKREKSFEWIKTMVIYFGVFIIIIYYYCQYYFASYWAYLHTTSFRWTWHVLANCSWCLPACFVRFVSGNIWFNLISSGGSDISIVNLWPSSFLVTRQSWIGQVRYFI